jgi:hypothetical protein
MANVIEFKDSVAVNGTISASGGTFDGIVNAAGGNSTNWNAAYAHLSNNNQAHSDYLKNDASDVTSGTLTATNFILSSDERLKTNIEPIPISSVNIEYKQFELISDPNQLRYGVIAQELQKECPELIRTDENGTLSVAYIDLLIKEIAYLKNKIAELEKKIG